MHYLVVIFLFFLPLSDNCERRDNASVTPLEFAARMTPLISVVRGNKR